MTPFIKPVYRNSFVQQDEPLVPYWVSSMGLEWLYGWLLQVEQYFQGSQSNSAS